MAALAGVLLVDADAFAKLAHWSLLELLPGLFDCDWRQICTLPSVKHRAQRVVGGKADRLFSDATIAQRALDAIDGMGEMPAPDLDRLAFFQSVPQIDAGEAVLFAAAQACRRIVTGDKRALAALGGVADTSVRMALKGKLVCVEQVLLAALDALGIDELRVRVCPHKAVDKTTAAIMGSRCQASERDVREGLLSYITALRNSCSLLVGGDGHLGLG